MSSAHCCSSWWSQEQLRPAGRRVAQVVQPLLGVVQVHLTSEPATANTAVGLPYILQRKRLPVKLRTLFWFVRKLQSAVNQSSTDVSRCIKMAAELFDLDTSCLNEFYETAERWKNNVRLECLCVNPCRCAFLHDCTSVIYVFFCLYF